MDLQWSTISVAPSAEAFPEREALPVAMLLLAACSFIEARIITQWKGVQNQIKLNLTQPNLSLNSDLLGKYVQYEKKFVVT